MDRFKISGLITIAMSGAYIAQFATSFPLIRLGCSLVLLGFFIAIAIDAALDKAKAEAEGFYGELLTIITPHLSAAAVLLFLIFVGVYLGWH
ncbi:MAG TPA: hypothetical protein V6C63_06860 [Allocoleopsis sp.]